MGVGASLEPWGKCHASLNALLDFAAAGILTFLSELRGDVARRLSTTLEGAVDRILLALLGIMYLVLIFVLGLFAYGCTITWSAFFLIVVVAFMIFYGLFTFIRQEIKDKIRESSTNLVSSIVTVIQNAGPTALAIGNVAYSLSLANPFNPYPSCCPNVNASDGGTCIFGPTPPTNSALNITLDPNAISAFTGVSSNNLSALSMLSANNNNRNNGTNNTNNSNGMLAATAAVGNGSNGTGNGGGSTLSSSAQNLIKFQQLQAIMTQQQAGQGRTNTTNRGGCRNC